MGKMKVHELAKELNITNSEMIDKLNKLGVQVKSHLAALEDEIVEKVRKTLAKKEVKKSGEHKEQVHIIRRNVKVINTSGDKKEVEEISTSISGDIKKSHRTLVDTEKSKSSYNKEELGVVKPRQNYNKRPNFMKNRTAGVVITRNGKPIEPQIKEEKNEKKEEKIVESKIENISEKEMNNVVEKHEKSEIKQKSYNKEEKNTETKRINENKTSNKEKYNGRNNNRNSNNSFNKDNRQNRMNQNNNSSPYNKRNRDNKDNRDNRDNTSYQVNKFIKQSSSMPVEQKETKDYNNINIDKKKYNENRTNENKKEKLDKNKLREKHSRVATSKLRGMEIDSDSGMLDLYERDSDKFRKGGSKKKNAKKQVSQTKIIPMTEVKLPETMTVKEFAEAIKSKLLKL